MRHQLPYAISAHAYLTAGFSPLPAKGKLLLVTGVSGIDGRMATAHDVSRWADEYADADVVLRLPTDVIGLDVDAYKDNLEALAKLERRHGKLPETWNADSRGGDGGKLLYRVPLRDSKWKSDIGGITTIQHTHRYVLVAPSYNEKSESVVKWYHGLGGPEIVDEIPDVADLPMLPAAWVAELLYAERYRQTTKTNPTDFDIFTLFTQGAPCEFMNKLIDYGEATLRGAYTSGLHDAGLHVIGRVLRAGCNGHTGVETALNQLERIFTNAPRPRDLASEWSDELSYAIAHLDCDERQTIDHCNIKLIFPKKGEPENELQPMVKLRRAGFSMSQARFMLRR